MAATNTFFSDVELIKNPRPASGITLQIKRLDLSQCHAGVIVPDPADPLMGGKILPMIGHHEMQCQCSDRTAAPVVNLVQTLTQAPRVDIKFCVSDAANRNDNLRLNMQNWTLAISWIAYSKREFGLPLPSGNEPLKIGVDVDASGDFTMVLNLDQLGPEGGEPREPHAVQ